MIHYHQQTTDNTDVTPSTEGPLSIDEEGNVSVIPGTPSGSYSITYEICETDANPGNCTTAVATVNIDIPIEAEDDFYTSVAGGTTSSILENDTLNGLTASDVTITGTDIPS